jgi:hypothetical protein
MKKTVEVEVEIEETPRHLAEIFGDWDAIKQAEFLEEVASITQEWQWYEIGRYLASDAATELVCTLARGTGAKVEMQYGF